MGTQEIMISGRKFRFVKDSRRSGVAVYTNGELFARVGKREYVERTVEIHKKFESFGFPVPEIVRSGEISEGAYYLEKSLGEKCFSYLFKDDIEKYGAISPELFEKFISVSEKFARAQIRSVAEDCSGSPITELVGPKDLAEELPEYGEKILRLYAESLEATKIFPRVLTHGDFNPHNIFPPGVIDFERAYCEPIGYDLVTNIFHITYFPESREYEYYRLYFFTEEQMELYYGRIDAIFLKAGLPKLSDYRRHFEYRRAIWAAARNAFMPKLQKWRWELFKKQYLA